MFAILSWQNLIFHSTVSHILTSLSSHDLVHWENLLKPFIWHEGFICIYIQHAFVCSLIGTVEWRHALIKNTSAVTLFWVKCLYIATRGWTWEFIWLQGDFLKCKIPLFEGRDIINTSVCLLWRNIWIYPQKVEKCDCISLRTKQKLIQLWCVIWTQEGGQEQQQHHLFILHQYHTILPDS